MESLLLLVRRSVRLLTFKSVMFSLRKVHVLLLFAMMFWQGAFLHAQDSVIDTDLDNIPDAYERKHGLDPVNPDDAGLDPDADSLSNLAEYELGTNPRDNDTDKDFLPDGWEVSYDMDPVSAHIEHLFSLWTFNALEDGAFPNGCADKASLVAASTPLPTLERGSVLNAATFFESGTLSTLNSFEFNTDSAFSLVFIANLPVAEASFLKISVPAENGDQDVFSVSLRGGVNSEAALNTAFGAASTSAVLPVSESALARQIAITFDQQQLTLFVDGKEVGSAPVDTNEPSDAVAQDVLNITVMPAGAKLQLDQLRVYTEALAQNNLASLTDAASDPDEDGLTNYWEMVHETDPYDADSDHDGIKDGDEVFGYQTNPLSADSDGDAMTDGWEVNGDLDPLNATDALMDSDGDGVNNLTEFKDGTNPKDADSLVNHVYVSLGWNEIEVGVDPDGAGPAIAMQSDAFASIQAALTHTKAPAHIHIHDGTYEERLHINKDVVLSAMTAATPTATDEAETQMPVVRIAPNDLWDETNSLMEIGTRDDSEQTQPVVAFRDITISGKNAYHVQAWPFVGINVHAGAELQMTRARLHWVRWGRIGMPTGWGIVAIDANLTLNQTLFTDCQKAAITAFGNGVAVIEGCHFIGSDLSDTIQFCQEAIFLQDAVGATIVGNTFENYDPSAGPNRKYDAAKSSNDGPGYVINMRNNGMGKQGVLIHDNMFIDCSAPYTDWRDIQIGTGGAVRMQEFLANGNTVTGNGLIGINGEHEISALFNTRTDTPNVFNLAVSLKHGGEIVLEGDTVYTNDFPVSNPGAPVTVSSLGENTIVQLTNTSVPENLVAGDGVTFVCSPAVHVRNLEPHQQFDTGETMQLETMVASQQPLAQVSLLVNDSFIETLTEPPFSFTWADMPEGAWNVKVVAETTTGMTGASRIYPVQVGQPNGFFREYWHAAWGSYYTQLLDNPLYPAAPDTQTYVQADFSAGNRDERNYGLRLRGYLIPPQTGQYQFSLTAHTDAALRISTNGQPEDASRIMRAVRRRADKWVTDKQTYTLDAGAPVYVDIVMKHCVSLDHVALGWKLPDGTWQRPIPLQHIVPFVPDAQSVETQWRDQNVLALDTNDASDADNDGLTDLEEINLSLTDPNIENTVHGVTTIKGNEADILLGGWETDRNTIQATSHAGRLAYQFDAPKAGIYRLTITARETHRSPDSDTFQLDCKVDGDYVGSASFHSTGESTSAIVYTPWLDAWRHQLTLSWYNVYPNKAPCIEKIDIDYVDSEAAQQARLDRQCQIRVLPQSSAVSPAFIEGTAPFRNQLHITAGRSQELATIAPLPSTGHGWYANVPLSPTETTDVTIDWQKQARQSIHTISWKPTYVFSAHDMRLRRGDSLKLQTITSDLPQAAEITISVGDATYTLQNQQGDHVIHTFDTKGTVTVQAQGTTEDGVVHTADFNVSVLDVTTPDSRPALWTGNARQWRWDGLPEAAVLDSGAFQIKTRRTKSNYRDLELMAPDYFTPGAFVARLSKNGPIITHIVPNVFEANTGAAGYMEVVEWMDDGSSVIENTLYLRDLPEDVEIHLTINTGGAIFGSGTTKIILDKSDLSELGTMTYTVHRPPGKTTPCHTIRMIQNGKNIGPWL